MVALGPIIQTAFTLALTAVYAEIDCPSDVKILGGQVQFLGMRKVNTVLQYICPEGTRATPVSWRVCGADGTWSPITRPAACVPFLCSGPITLERGWTFPRLTQYRVGQRISFHCQPGHILYGAANITCLPTGKWTAPPAVCDTGESFCGNPGVPAGGMKVGNHFEMGHQVQYSCYTGLMMRGPKLRTCQDDGSWSGVDPECEGQHTYDDPEMISKHFGLSEHALLSPDQELHLYFLVKVSRSVGTENVERALDFVYLLTNQVSGHTKPKKVDVIISGASAKNVSYDRIRKVDEKDFQEYLNGTGVNTGEALGLVLRLIRDRLATTGNSRPAKNILILITDGQHNMGPSPYSVIQDMKDTIPKPEANLEIFVIGIGGAARRAGLENIASQRSEPRAFYLPDYTALQDSTPEVSRDTCGVRVQIRSRARVFRGELSADRQWPWQVMVQCKGVLMGGGTIIAQQWVLTAAHVVHGFDVGDVAVVAGVTVMPSPDKPVSTLGVEEIIKHEAYVHEMLSFDIALLKLQKKIDFSTSVRPVCLPCTADLSKVFNLPSQNWTSRCAHQELILTGDGGEDHRVVSGFVTGWGLTGVNSDIQGRDLRHGRISLATRDQCEGVLAKLKILLTKEKFCAKGENVDSCAGDSGGPFIIKRNGRWIQIGIVSYGTSTYCVRGTTGVYTSVPRLMHWIRKKVGEDMEFD